MVQRCPHKLYAGAIVSIGAFGLFAPQHAQPNFLVLHLRFEIGHGGFGPFRIMLQMRRLRG